MSTHTSPTGTPPRLQSTTLAIPTNGSQNPGPPAAAVNPPSSMTNNNANAQPQRNNNRYNPPVPQRMSGTYSNNNIHHGNLAPNLTGRRLGTSSASSSPPGTPPNGLRDYYLSAALHRSHNRYYGPGAYSGSATNLQRPNLSILVPPQNSNISIPQATVARRSYSAGHLSTDEPEITVTTPGGSKATEEHVKTLEDALNNLIEKEGRASVENDDEEEDDDETDGPIMMKSSSKSKSTSAPSTVSKGKKDGVLLTPKVLANRLEPERTVESDLTLSDPGLPEKEKKQLKDKDKEKDKRKSHRISRFFYREPTATTAVPEEYFTSRQPAPSSIQPSKTGVLSNLLRLQSGSRQHKHYRVSTPPKQHKEKKKRTLYSRSANASVTSLAHKNIFGTYPPLPVTASAIGLANLGAVNNRNGHNNNISAMRRSSSQLENAIAAAFAQGHSPIHSPNDSPRDSFSYDNTAVGTTIHSLSDEEKMRITFAMADILQRQDYVLRLAKAMIRFGAPSHRLESAIDHTARTLELNLQCIYMPNLMIIAFTDFETHTSETHLLKTSAGLDMYKFAQVHQVLKLVAHSSIPVEEAIMKLDAINAEPDIWPRWANILSYALASFCAASMFFKGNWIDAGVAFLIGGLVGLMSWLSEKVPSYSHICEVTMSVLVAFIAEALHDQVCRSAVKMAGIVMLLPGYTITCSILELCSRQMISGSVRLFYAIIFSLLLGYGLTIGGSLWNLIDPRSVPAAVTGTCPESLDPKWNILFVPVFALSLNVWLKAHPRQWILATVFSIIGYMVSYSTSTWAGAKTEVSSALAAFSIGFMGNVYQRITHQLTFQAVVCAVFFLVPGSMGLKGAMAWFTDDMAGGVNFALQMVITAIAISVGLFASALVVYPMGKARSAQMTF
ncbi:hypothetical protein BX616_005909 [Lobosporangium transversale]|uniref:Threonine/serine exporter-like N-terminal domain-containing protein n=1 Tax=Lobosporangium transversale TaxID=64571 RepID=A0A1Y2GN93_9FUNG|nr:hypothetical protein BCR41DRAFT_423097 [Lobosporangium transversale]KAF9915549.1 hypothetical protein BX616_005909 [Lobosporangium transversale]ORZ12444.1 hypothetical protein BCR41DRAFT_423097 [Lobosporangium transversale]|eukprot:XP_021880063.1 hypothetical protein BCR41DRAFT_423097 [Lobosporangium transversale]